MRQFLSRLKKQLPERRAVIVNPPLQGPIAQPELARHGGNFRTGSGEQAFENLLHLFAGRTLRMAGFNGFGELRVQHLKQLDIVRNKWPVKIGCVEHQQIAARPEFDRAFEISFVDSGRFCFAL